MLMGENGTAGAGSVAGYILEMVSLLQAWAGDVDQRGRDRPHNGTGLDSVLGHL